MRGRSLTARALSRYFVDEGITTYTHVSDQHSTYGTQVIVSTERDATLHPRRDPGQHHRAADHRAHHRHPRPDPRHLRPVRPGRARASRPASPSSPRSRLWRPHPASHYQRWPLAGPLLEHHAQIELIAEHWDDLLRIAGSLKLGHVSAALLVTRLQAGSRQHPLAKALHRVRQAAAHRSTPCGGSPTKPFRRRIGRQLNRGEALNDLRRFIAFAHRGDVRYRHHDDQTMQAHCLTLVTNTCVLSTTGYLQDAIDAHRADGIQVSDEAIAHLSPASFEQHQPLRTHTIDIAAILNRSQRRPLREPLRRSDAEMTP